MLRILFGVVGGYLTMVILAVLLVSLLYPLLGPERVFHPGTIEGTSLWLGLTLAAGALAAAAGGRVAIAVAQRHEAVIALAGAVFVLGVYAAWSNAGTPPPAVNMDDLGMFEITRHIHRPAWYAWILPVIGAACVWMGGMGQRG